MHELKWVVEGSVPSTPKAWPRQKIAFTGFTSGPEKVYLVDAKGGSPQPIIQDDVPQSNPMWLPDGNSLVISSGIDPGESRELNIHQFDLKTQKLSKILGSDGMVGSRVSPDGRYIVASLKQTPQKLMLFEYATQK